MPSLNLVVSRSEWEALPETVRAHYTPNGEMFVLTLGDDYEFIPVAQCQAEKAKLAEFEANNRSLLAEQERFRALKEKFKGVDPEEYRRLKTEAATIEQAVAATIQAVKGIGDNALGFRPARICRRFARFFRKAGGGLQRLPNVWGTIPEVY